MKSTYGRNFIYGLVDPRTGKIRYVGKTSHGMKRPRAHGTKSAIDRERNYARNWIKSLQNVGLTYEIVVLETLDSSDLLSEAEIRWIKKLREEGADLTNLTDGGEGTVGYKHTEEARKKIGAAAVGNTYSAGATWWVGRKHTEETRKN